MEWLHGSDPSGRCAAIKVVFGDYTILVINVYLPCFNASGDYIHDDDMHEYLGYIESLLSNEVHAYEIIGGDFNLPFELLTTGYRLLSSLMSDCNVLKCLPAEQRHFSSLIQFKNFINSVDLSSVVSLGL